LKDPPGVAITPGGFFIPNSRLRFQCRRKPRRDSRQTRLTSLHLDRVRATGDIPSDMFDPLTVFGGALGFQGVPLASNRFIANLIRRPCKNEKDDRFGVRIDASDHDFRAGRRD
jgi:hypothetical protein